MTAALILPDATVRMLNEQFTHSFYSAAGYLFEAQPHTVAADQPLLDALDAIREDDRSHAKLLGNILQLYDRVPEPGAFPYWYRDLNYLTVPYMAGFVVESLENDLARYDTAAKSTPQDLRLVHATLRDIRKDKAERLEALRPLVAQAHVREEQAYAADIAAIKRVRDERLAKEKAEAEAARRAKAAARVPAAADPAAGMPDPGEPGISAKEKAKRTMLIKRARAQAAKAAPAAPAADPAAGMPDPNEPGISAKEKAKRTMMIKRARAAAAKVAPSTGSGPAAADPIAAMPDPNEEGISAKEKAKRTMLIKRARAAAAKAAPPAPVAADPAAGMPDPNEEGISAKERAKRTMMIKRAQKKLQGPESAEGAQEDG